MLHLMGDHEPIRDPILPPEHKGHIGLSPKDLENDLLEHVKLDEKFKPLLALLEAVKEPGKDFEADIQRALKQIEEDNKRSGPVPDFEIPDPEFKTSTDVLEADALGALYTTDWEFDNWGKTVHNTPSTTWQIRTRTGVQNLVKWAAKQNKRVRVSGFRHSWTNIFGANGDVIMMLQPYKSLVDLPFMAPKNWKSDLTGVTGPIASVGPANRTPPPGHAFFKVGAGTINDDFRKWCFENKKYCIPLNVIMVEVTFGGTNAPVCHGSGFSTTTLSDLVVEVEYVDAQGNVQVVNDPEELKVASGCFGLLGVVTSITLQLEDMYVAELAPTKVPMVLAIPPPEGYPLPKAVKEMMMWHMISEKDLTNARKDFIKRCEEDYYLEWFWFPYQQDCWINTWKRRPAQPQDASIATYPDDNIFTGAATQALQGTIAETIVNWKWWWQVSGHNQAWWFGLASMAALPNVKKGEKPIEALQSDALHFRRGIQNFRVWDTEWEIPVPSKAGKRDYGLIQRAWWDAITEMYANPEAPVRVALEMRLTGGSNVLLAPQRGNTNGTASIEVLTTLTTPPEVWQGFMQTMADKWTNYKDENGKLLNARPHWAKQWEGITVHGKPINAYLREEAYKDALPAFQETFGKIVAARGGNVAETRERFGNALMDELIFGDKTPVKPPTTAPGGGSASGGQA